MPARTTLTAAAKLVKAAAKSEAPTFNPHRAKLGEFNRTIGKMSVKELIDVRTALDASYQKARLDESVAANRTVIRKWDAVEWRIEQLSGPSGGE